MKISKVLLTSAALIASLSASAGAQITGSLGGGFGLFHTITGPSGGACAGANCTINGIGTVSGGRTYNGDQGAADINAFGAFVSGGVFLAAGPNSSGAATLTITDPNLTYLSFDWGSPDLYNSLTVSYTGTTSGSNTYTAASLGFPVTNGSQSFAQYVQFQASAGYRISSLKFDNIPSTDAFEVANFSTTSTVPEPSTYALMAAGLAALAFASKRRKVA